MKILRTYKRLLLVFCVFTFALIGATALFGRLDLAVAYSEQANWLTGGKVTWDWGHGGQRFESQYSDIADDDYLNYNKAVKYFFKPYGKVHGGDGMTCYANTHEITLVWEIDRSAFNYLYRSYEMTVARGTGTDYVTPTDKIAYTDDSAEYWRLTYTYNLPDGKYTFRTCITFNGKHSPDIFYYDQYIIVDTAAPTLAAAETHSQTEVYANYSASSTQAPVSATYTHNGNYMGAYASGTKLTSEGKYVITATDKAGNSSSKTLYVDRTPPQILGARTGKTDISASWQVGEYETPVTAATYTYNGTSKGAYASGTKLTAEGKYVITATDAAGNSASDTFYVDRTSPKVSATTTVSKTWVSAAVASAGAYESPITTTYTHNGAAKGAYGSGTSLSAEGKYVITATDAAGNSASVTLYVDRTPPTISGTRVSKTSIAADWSVGANESSVSAKYTYNGINKGAYNSGTKLTAEGKYVITATDAAGNSVSDTFYVDRTPPQLMYPNNKTGPSFMTRDSAFVKWNVGEYETPVTATYAFASADESKAPSTPSVEYVSERAFTLEGTYTVTAVDAAGNRSIAVVVIDRTPPILIFSTNGGVFDKYTNAAFTASGDDVLSGVDLIELYENGSYTPYDFAPRADNGAYLFRISDKAGNTTIRTATLYATDTFGNLASIRDAYKLNAWYTVTLPARIFTTPNKDVAGRYSFESYADALAFAKSAEREFRVTAVQGGFMYVSVANEAIAQKYDTDATLSAAVEKYAKGYISSRQTALPSGADKYYVEPTSLTRNSPSLPDYLLEFKNLSRFFARPSTVWSLPKLTYISDMPYSVTAKYLGDFEEETTQKEFLISSGTTLLSSVAEQGEYRQGWYLITESDAAGNVERYLIYSDAELPTARVTATFGDGQEDLTLDYDYTRNETLYFISLELNSLLDNVDTYVTLKLEKGSAVKYFTQSDVLPVLGSSEYGSGKYTVTIFDRSLNVLIFDVFIAGDAPTMTHGSLAADKPECRISFMTSDRYNVITGITLYKIEYDGTKTKLDTDGNGTPVNAETLSYILTVGGKYGATLTDNYRRTLELPTIFFLKGLPSGKLSGVSDGGRTNKNVSFAFDSADIAELFVLLPNGERRAFSDYTVQTGAAQTVYNIAADETTSHEYLVFLHNAQDLSLFVEYTFEIDTVLPSFEITNADGSIILPDGATNKPFSIKWQETGVTVRYYTARSGSLSATRYNMNTVLSQGALYYFTIRDDVGNTLEFTVLLDNAVDYTIAGKRNEVDGVLYANAPLTFTVNEPTQTFDVENADGYTIANGGVLMKEGRYEITVTDNYGNTVRLVVVLDLTPPTLELIGAESGDSVKTDVAVSASGYDYLYLSDGKGNKLKDISDGTVFSESGRYYITASDYAGNAVTVTFGIDLSVDYTLSVPNGAVTTDRVVLESTEQLTVDVLKDGQAVESSTKFTVPGFYELTLSDALGNSVSCVFVIVPKRGRTLEVSMPVGTMVAAVMRDGAMLELERADILALDTTGSYAVTLDCGGVGFTLELEIDNAPPVATLESNGRAVTVAAVDKENVELKITKDGEEISCSIGKTFDEPGHYVLTVTDELGNSSTYEFTIPYRLNAWAIVAIVVGAVVLLVGIILIIRARRKPRMK